MWTGVCFSEAEIQPADWAREVLGCHHLLRAACEKRRGEVMRVPRQEEKKKVSAQTDGLFILREFRIIENNDENAEETLKVTSIKKLWFPTICSFVAKFTALLTRCFLILCRCAACCNQIWRSGASDTKQQSVRGGTAKLSAEMCYKSPVTPTGSGNLMILCGF